MSFFWTPQNSISRKTDENQTPALHTLLVVSKRSLIRKHVIRPDRWENKKGKKYYCHKNFCDLKIWTFSFDANNRPDLIITKNHSNPCKFSIKSQKLSRNESALI